MFERNSVVIPPSDTFLLMTLLRSTATKMGHLLCFQGSVQNREVLLIQPDPATLDPTTCVPRSAAPGRTTPVTTWPVRRTEPGPRHHSTAQVRLHGNNSTALELETVRCYSIGKTRRVWSRKKYFQWVCIKRTMHNLYCPVKQTLIQVHKTQKIPCNLQSNFPFSSVPTACPIHVYCRSWDHHRHGHRRRDNDGRAHHPIPGNLHKRWGVRWDLRIGRGTHNRDNSAWRHHHRYWGRPREQHSLHTRGTGGEPGGNRGTTHHQPVWSWDKDPTAFHSSKQLQFNQTTSIERFEALQVFQSSLSFKWNVSVKMCTEQNKLQIFSLRVHGNYAVDVTDMEALPHIVTHFSHTTLASERATPLTCVQNTPLLKCVWDVVGVLSPLVCHTSTTKSICYMKTGWYQPLHSIIVRDSTSCFLPLD